MKENRFRGGIRTKDGCLFSTKCRVIQKLACEVLYTVCKCRTEEWRYPLNLQGSVRGPALPGGIFLAVTKDFNMLCIRRFLCRVAQFLLLGNIIGINFRNESDSLSCHPIILSKLVITYFLWKTRVCMTCISLQNFQCSFKQFYFL